MLEEKVEILSVELLKQHRLLVDDLKQLARSLRLEFGWHYLLDLTWIISQLEDLAGDGYTIMDAGAGVGVMQWYLARQGTQVISVDRSSRSILPTRFRSRFQINGLRPEDLQPATQVIRQRFNPPTPKGRMTRFKSGIREILDSLGRPGNPGRVLIYNQDLGNLVDIPDASLDAIVSVSALEHNSQDGLVQVVAELMRVLKPGGALLATLTAARDQDWWHAESSAWCYTDTTLRRIFDLNPGASSNYARYDELFTAICECVELREGLASFYYQSGKNGMPWGIWDPKYQPVGVCKRK